MTTAEVEDNLSQRRMEKSEGVWIVGTLVELEKEREGTDRLVCRSEYWATEDQRDESCLKS